MSPLLLAILRAALRPITAVIKPPAIPTQRIASTAAYDAALTEWRAGIVREVEAERRKQRHQVWCRQVAAKADALTPTDVDALFEQLEDERAGGVW